MVFKSLRCCEKSLLTCFAAESDVILVDAHLLLRRVVHRGLHARPCDFHPDLCRSRVRVQKLQNHTCMGQVCLNKTCPHRLDAVAVGVFLEVLLPALRFPVGGNCTDTPSDNEETAYLSSFHGIAQNGSCKRRPQCDCEGRTKHGCTCTSCQFEPDTHAHAQWKMSTWSDLSGTSTSKDQ